MCSEIQKLELQKNTAYRERNQLVMALSKIFPGHLAKHPETDQTWEADWRNIVVLYLPARLASNFTNRVGEVKDVQMSWHIHDSELPLFDHLELKDFAWDGHTTDEKYRRLRRFKGVNLGDILK